MFIVTLLARRKHFTSQGLKTGALILRGTKMHNCAAWGRSLWEKKTRARPKCVRFVTRAIDRLFDTALFITFYIFAKGEHVEGFVAGRRAGWRLWRRFCSTGTEIPEKPTSSSREFTISAANRADDHHQGTQMYVIPYPFPPREPTK